MVNSQYQNKDLVTCFFERINFNEVFFSLFGILTKLCRIVKVEFKTTNKIFCPAAVLKLNIF